MAIKSKRNFETVMGADDLELEAKKGQSLLIKNVMIYEPDETYAIFKIGTTTVGCFRVNSVLGNHLQIPRGRANHAHNITMGTTAAIPIAGNAARLENAGGTETPILFPTTEVETTYDRVMNEAMSAAVGSETILQYLMGKGLFEGYPVESGEKFLITEVDAATAVKIVEYEIHDEGDISADMPNGSKADVLTYISYGETGAVLKLEVDEVLDTSNNPPEFNDFPFGAIVPADTKIEVLGILASDVSPAANAAAAYTSTRYLKLMKGIEFLFDRKRNGLPYYSDFDDAIGNQDMIAEGFSVGGNYTEIDRREPLMFDPPIEFLEGQKLTVMWNTETDGTTGVEISRALQEIGLILRLSPA